VNNKLWNGEVFNLGKYSGWNGETMLFTDGDSNLCGSHGKRSSEIVFTCGDSDKVNHIGDGDGPCSYRIKMQTTLACAITLKQCTADSLTATADAATSRLEAIEAKIKELEKENQIPEDYKAPTLRPNPGTDWRCGPNFNNDGCDPRSYWPCCSSAGHCGYTPAHCECSGCVDYRKDCKLTKMGTEYRGKVKVTKSGKTCQRWDSETPHKHAHYSPSSHPSYGLVENYCRNPSHNQGGPWCYTTDPNKRWEYCQIYECPSVFTDLGQCNVESLNVLAEKAKILKNKVDRIEAYKHRDAPGGWGIQKKNDFS